MRARITPGLVIREARAADNDELIALELRSPLVIGRTEEGYNRAPDFFACHGVQGEHRVVLAELNGRTVGVMAGVLQSPQIQGRTRRLVHIQRARVDPEHQGEGVAWMLANDLFAWAGRHGAEGPYYLIAPGNERSVAFGGRAGRRWPEDLRLLAFDVSDVAGERAAPLSGDQISDAAALINATHAGEEFFEPLTADSLSERLGRDRSYGLDNQFAVVSEGHVRAVAGLWDKGATTERIEVDRASGTVVKSRSTRVVDWGWAPGFEREFAALLRSLAAVSRGLGRREMMICEPRPGAVPATGLEGHEVRLSLYTPTIDPPAESAIGGLFADLLTV